MSAMKASRPFIFLRAADLYKRESPFLTKR
jgi:hypothetical protein